MTEIINTSSLHQNHQTFKSLTLSQFSDSNKPHEVKRGPRYKEYSNLRDKWLRTKNCSVRGTPEKENRPVLTPQKKQVKFSCNATPPRKKANPSSIMAQSVPDFSSFLRKENRKPPTTSSPLSKSSVTPPAMKGGKMYGKIAGGGGSKSANSGEKRSGGAVVMSCKSYANVEELKGLARAAGNAIVNGGLKSSRNTSNVFGFRQV